MRPAGAQSLIIGAALLLAPWFCGAYETDQFTNRLTPLADSTELLDARVNRTIEEIARDWKGPRNDWKFVTAIYNPDNDKIGNDLYRGLGDGTFERVTDSAGVDQGFWGWGACAGDFDNDGWQDIFHVNGWHDAGQWGDDPSRFFHSNGDGTFTERSEEVGLIETDQGRGVVCFDADRDGDLDIFVSNHSEFGGLPRVSAPRDGPGRAALKSI